MKIRPYVCANYDVQCIVNYKFEFLFQFLVRLPIPQHAVLYNLSQSALTTPPPTTSSSSQVPHIQHLHFFSSSQNLFGAQYYPGLGISKCDTICCHHIHTVQLRFLAFTQTFSPFTKKHSALVFLRLDAQVFVLMTPYKQRVWGCTEAFSLSAWVLEVRSKSKANSVIPNPQAGNKGHILCTNNTPHHLALFRSRTTCSVTLAILPSFTDGILKYIPMTIDVPLLQ